ncbi:tetratricopeptide (TPR) repeat protein [Bradyrhizobium sp. USDA 3051]
MQSSAGARAFQNARLQKKLKKQADALMSAAVQALGQGRYAEVETLCRRILTEVPDHFDAAHLLGLRAYDGGRLDEAQQLLERATVLIRVRPMPMVISGRCISPSRSFRRLAHARRRPLR